MILAHRVGTAILAGFSLDLGVHGDPWTLGILAGDVATAAPTGIVCANGFARLITEIRARVPRSLLAVPVAHEPDAARDVHVDWPHADLVALPPMVSTVRAQRHWLGAWRTVRQFVQRVDALIVRWPFQLPLHALGLGKPRVLHVVADVAAVVGASQQRGPLGTLMARAFAGITEAIGRRIAHEPQTRTVANGSRLLTLFGAQARGRAVVSSALRASDVPPIALRKLHDPARVLFVGYTRPEKGIDLLLSSVAQLSRSRPITLTIAGGDDRAGTRSIMDRVALPENAHTVGPVAFGEPLFELFRTHDVLVVPSRSEGTPRVLVEARAFSCPVIATDVGGIPDSVRDGETGLLVPREDAPALASAIARLLDDEALRTHLIDRGHAFASGCTVEAYADAILDELSVARGGAR